MTPPPATSVADRPRLHTLVVGETDRQRRGAVSRWVDGELAVGSKVLYKGWLDHGGTVERHWLAGPGGPRHAREALASGQLEFLDIPAVVAATGGTADALLAFQGAEVHAALDAGWDRVAMSAESPRRAMGDGETEQLRAHETGLTALVASAPVTTLCQLAVGEENDTAIWETVGVHHRDLVDGPWSASEVGGVWTLAGELDAHVARRFAAGLRAALTDDAPRHGDPALHVDLSRVEFMDVACVRMIELAARGLEVSEPGARIVLRGPSRLVRRLVEAVGRPRTLVVADG